MSKSSQFTTSNVCRVESPTDEIAIGILSDMHCGHMLGLTPPDDFRALEAEDPDIRLLAKKQREFWDTYCELIRLAGPVDHLLINGDCIDGDGFRLEGAETIAQTPDQAARMAARCVKKWITPSRTKSVHMIGGTPSHTWFGSLDMERLVRDSVLTKCPVVSYDQAGIVEFSFPNANKEFRILQRHDTPKGGIRTGGAGPGAIRQSVGYDLEFLYNGYADLRPDMLVFSHAHEAFFAMQPLAGLNRYIIVTPCLQGSGSVYGKTKCIGTISWGITVIILRIVRGEFEVTHKFLTRTLVSNRPQVSRVVYANAK